MSMASPTPVVSNDSTDDELGETTRKPIGHFKILKQAGVAEEIYPIYEGETLIGRDASCHIRLPIRGLSRKHACIEAAVDVAMIYDMGSRNGTYRGQLSLKRGCRYELTNESSIRLSRVECMYFAGGPGASASSTTPASDTESEGNSEPILSMQRGMTSEKMDTGDGGVEKTEETLHGFADHLIDESDEDIPVRRTVNIESTPLQKVEEEKSSLAGTLMIDASKTLVIDSDDDDDDNDENRRKTNEETRASSSALEASKTLILESDDDDEKTTEKARDASLTLEASKTLILDSDDDNDDGRKTTKDSSLDGASIRYQAQEESNKPSSKSDSGDDDPNNEAGSSILDAFLSESGRKGIVTGAGDDSVAETQAYRYESDPDEKEKINEEDNLTQAYPVPTTTEDAADNAQTLAYGVPSPQEASPVIVETSSDVSDRNKEKKQEEEMEVTRESPPQDVATSRPASDDDSPPVVATGRRKTVRFAQESEEPSLPRDDDNEDSSSNHRQTNGRGRRGRGRGKRGRSSAKKDSQESTSQASKSSRGRGRGQKRGSLAEDEDDSAVVEAPSSKRRRASKPSAAATTASLPSPDVPKVMFTGLRSTAAERIVRNLGGNLVDSVFECTHLIAEKVMKTIKFLCVVARGKMIVSSKWLDACKRAGSFIDASPYILCDAASEREHSFQLRRSIEKAASKTLLNGYKIHVTPNVKPPPSAVKDVIECSGGMFLLAMPTEVAENTVIVSCDEDARLCARAARAGIPIYRKDFLVDGVLKQEILVGAKLDVS